MRIKWGSLLASGGLLAMMGLMFIGTLMGSGASLMLPGKWPMSIFLLAAGCPIFWISIYAFQDFRQEFIPFARWLRWKCSRVREALLEPMPEEECYDVLWEDRDAC